MPEPIVLLLALAGAGALLAMVAERQFRTLPALPLSPIPAALPSLSILVPARDEAENLARLLPSLLGAVYPGALEIIVVDDNSADGTSQVARAAGARVVAVDHLPAGWLGKPHACHRGVAEARGEWLLFTDADTVHDSASPAAAMAYVLQHRLDGLSLFLRQETHGLWDQLPLLTIFAGFFAAFSNRKPVLNGQYVLLRRDVYDGSGGFAAVRREPLEDLALGRRLHASGYRVPVLSGEAAGSVRMYRSFSQLWHGLGRLGAGTLRRAEPGSWIMVLCVVLAASPLWMGHLLLAAGHAAAWVLSAWLIVAAAYTPWARRMGPGWAATLAPVGAVLVGAAATWGLLRRALGYGFLWKRRRVSHRGWEGGDPSEP